MMTPQEVASHVFAKATLGGYNMAMVDEFLDLLTEDYTALYNDNAILKNKLKVLSDTVEEYRATDNAMRKTLLAAQQMAEAMVSDAEKKKSQLEKDAESNAAARIAQLEADIAAEEYRLRQAQEATAAYVKKLQDMHQQEVDFLAQLGQLVPPEVAVDDDPTSEIEASVSALLEKETAPALDDTAVYTAVEEPDPAPAPAIDLDVTRRFDDLQFGRDYEIQ